MMAKMRKIISMVLCLAFVFVCSMTAAADIDNTVSFASAAEAAQIATECYSDDLLLPLEDVVTTASAPGTNLQIPAKSAVLMEASTGQVLYEQNAHEALAPASITKVMSLLLIMEAMAQGRFTLETMVSASEYACSMGGSQIWLEPGESMSVNDLLKATVIASANDATVALAELVDGSEEGFVNKMNLRAEQLGMKETHFVNCTGLDAEGHVTSAYDVAVMSRELISHETIKNYTTVWMDTLRDGKSGLVNTNKVAH